MDDRELWLDFIRKNKDNLRYAVAQYEDCWYNIREQMAEQGIELTPDELNDLVSLVRDSLLEIE